MNIYLFHIKDTATIYILSSLRSSPEVYRGKKCFFFNSRLEIIDGVALIEQPEPRQKFEKNNTNH